MQRGLSVWAVVTAALGLAINGDHIRAHRLDGLHPLQNALLELFQVDAGKHAPKRIMGGNTVRQRQKRL